MSNARIAAVAVMTAAIVLITMNAPSCRGDAPPRSAELEAEVRRLLGDLQAATRAARNAAWHRLLELGPQVLPYLPPPELLSTVSVRESVDSIRHELERRQAKASTKASRIALDGTRPLKEWLAEISRQSGNRIDARGLPPELQERSLSFDVQTREFWTLVDDLSSRGGFMFESNGSGRGLMLKVQSDDDARSAAVTGYAGPFRLTAFPVEFVSVGGKREPAGPVSRERLLRLMLSIQPEPRLRPLFLQYATADILASARDSGKLRPFSPEASYELAVSEPGGKSNLQLDYVPPAGRLPEALVLKGKLRMTVAAGSASIRFDDVAKRADGKPIGIDRRRGGVTVTLHRVRRDPGPDGTVDLRVQVTVAYDIGGPAFESHRTWMLHNEVYLETASRMPLPVNGGFETTMEADGAVGMEYRFVGLSDPLADYSFVYVAPTLIVDVPVEFALESIPVKPPSSRR